MNATLFLNISTIDTRDKKASDYTVVVNKEENKNAACYYPAAKEAAAKITDYIAYWKGVIISE